MTVQVGQWKGPLVPSPLHRLLSVVPALLLGLGLGLDAPRQPWRHGPLAWAASAPAGSRDSAGAAAGQTLQRDPLHGLLVLAYHEITPPGTALVPDYAISPAQFEAHLLWLKANGYHFVSLDQVLAARAGRQPLPARPVLLSFDDGYRSTWTHAFPLLQRLHAPAVLSLVGRWLQPSTGMVPFGDSQIPRQKLLSWSELRAMTASGLVEVANHTFDLHHTVAANPQGNTAPAVTTRQWQARGGYERESAYRRRLAADLERNNAFLARHLGRRPRVVSWPYGNYNATASAVASAAGLPVGLTLDDGPNDSHVPLAALRRLILTQDAATPAGLAQEIAQHDWSANRRPLKVMHVDLDNIHDPDPAQQQRNLDLLIRRIQAMGVNTVFLQAFADPDGDGAADALYFPNRELPVRADLFSHVAAEIHGRTGVRRVFAWMPVLAFHFPTARVPASELVRTQPSRSGHLAMGYHRISPFAPEALERVRHIYSDLARYTTVEGVLFHDDLTLSDYEDANPAALERYRSWGLPTDLAAIRDDPRLLQRWTAHKTHVLDQFSLELAALVRREHPQLLTARNLYAQVLLNPQAANWYAQSLDSALRLYDFTAVMAMPYMEQAPDAEAFFRQLVAVVQARPGAMGRTLFELQSTDWRTNRDLPSQELASDFRLLYGLGVHHLGYYPDNLHRGNPDPALIRPVLASHTLSSAAPAASPAAAPAAASAP